MKNAVIIPAEQDRLQNNWPSLQVIGQGLERNYDSFLKNKVKIEAPFSMASHDFEKFQESIAKLPMQSRLIFPYALPKQVRLLKPLLSLVEEKNFQCRVHLYGDFFQQWPEWKDLLERMPQKNFNVAVLSSRFAEVISRTIQASQDILTIIPGLDLSSFSFDENRRVQVRKKMNLQKDELLIATVSRINERKGFFRNFEVVKELSKKQKVRWVVAGDFDDWNLPYGGEVFPAGYTFASITQFLKTENPKFEIEFLGHIEPAQVSALCDAADLFLHRSQSFEEDFSLAAREALASGLPCLFDNWGPFSDLVKYENALFEEQNLAAKIKAFAVQRKSLSQKVIQAMKIADQKSFLNFLSLPMSFDSEKMKPLDMKQFTQIMKGTP